MYKSAVWSLIKMSDSSVSAAFPCSYFLFVHVVMKVGRLGGC